MKRGEKAPSLVQMRHELNLLLGKQSALVRVLSSEALERCVLRCGTQSRSNQPPPLADEVLLRMIKSELRSRSEDGQ